MPPTLDIGHCCLQGNYRSNNEDYVAVRQCADWTLCLVADGMGGQDAGSRASRIGVEVVAQRMRCLLAPRAESEAVRSAFQEAIALAHREVLALNPSAGPRRGGTTLVGAAWRDGEVHIAHVGDSLAFLLRDGAVKQLTQVHDVVSALVANGTITADQARPRRWCGRNVLYKYLGCPELTPATPDLCSQTTRPGDHLLLCTDGLSNVISPEQILACVRAGTAQQSADALCRQAMENGSRDNVSCVLLRVAEQDAVARPRPPGQHADSWPPDVIGLTRAFLAGEDCLFALHDALLDADEVELAEHFEEPGHPRDCWAVCRILGRA